MAQSAKAVLVSNPDGLRTEKILAPASGSGGDVLQLADGRAAVALGLSISATAFLSGETISVATNGVWSVLKTASIALLRGGQSIWDRSAETAGFAKASGDFFLGTIAKDAVAADTTVNVELNVKPVYAIELNVDPFTIAVSNGLSTLKNSVASHVLTMAFDSATEAAMAALYSDDTVPVADLGVLEGRVCVYEDGDHAALDINFGVANATHATDMDTATETCLLHVDGDAGSLEHILAESDDGSTEVAATDTTVDYVEQTFFEFWMDFRNIDDIQIYINGVLVLPATVFKLDAATGPMLIIAHLEKESNDTTADVRIDFLRLRSTDEAA